MVGAGEDGIGCELLKTLALSGFQDIHIVVYLYVVNSLLIQGSSTPTLINYSG